MKGAIAVGAVALVLGLVYLSSRKRAQPPANVAPPGQGGGENPLAALGTLACSVGLTAKGGAAGAAAAGAVCPGIGQVAAPVLQAVVDSSGKVVGFAAGTATQLASLGGQAVGAVVDVHKAAVGTIVDVHKTAIQTGVTVAKTGANAVSSGVKAVGGAVSSGVKALNPFSW